MIKEMEREKINSLKSKVEALKSAYLSDKGKRDALLEQQKQLTKDYDEEYQKLQDLKIEKETVLKAAATAREHGRKLIEDLSTDAIQMSLDQDLNVKIDTQLKRGVPYTDLTISGLNGSLSTSPDENAGGIADIVAMSVFTSISSLVKENTAPLFLDEPTKYVSLDNHERVASFIEKIPEYTGKQIFVSTHDDVYLSKMAGKTFELDKDLNTGITKVEVK